jgi:two-component system alkaline phosphatase synthesis response regulator PhoP
MATAKGSEYDKVIGLDLGADDYLVKPFGMLEMVARIRAVLRRSTPGKGAASISAGAVELDTVRHTVHVEGLPVSLTLKEYDILQLLLEHQGQVFSRDQLLEKAWGIDYAGETRTVDVHIGTLRTKLGSAGRMIVTVRGVGYKLEVPDDK